FNPMSRFSSPCIMKWLTVGRCIKAFFRRFPEVERGTRRRGSEPFSVVDVTLLRNQNDDPDATRTGERKRGVKMQSPVFVDGPGHFDCFESVHASPHCLQRAPMIAPGGPGPWISLLSSGGSVSGIGAWISAILTIVSLEHSVGEDNPGERRRAGLARAAPPRGVPEAPRRRGPRGLRRQSDIAGVDAAAVPGRARLWRPRIAACPRWTRRRQYLYPELPARANGSSLA